MKPMKFHELPTGTLFRIFAEKRFIYERGERSERPKFVRSRDGAVFKKHGSSHSSTKDGRDIILAPHDLVTVYVNPNKGVKK